MTAKNLFDRRIGVHFPGIYGLPPLNAPDGTPVNAVYGFTNMFLKLTSKIGCDYTLVLFDAKRENFRNQIFPEYKATRREVPEELIPQFPIIREAVGALKLNYLEMEGYEADDLIATYARLALEQGMEAVVVSADKDLMQLIRPGVEFYDPMKDKFLPPKTSGKNSAFIPTKWLTCRRCRVTVPTTCPGFPASVPKPRPNWSTLSARWNRCWLMPGKSNRTSGGKRFWPTLTMPVFRWLWCGCATTFRWKNSRKIIPAAVPN